MAYTVLARKYRSQRFEEVVGQEAIAQTLKNAIETGRVAHAYLFTGTRGVGKTTMARILAKALNCLSAEGPTPQPCCKCNSCEAINIGEDIDVIEIDGASNTGVDDVRKLRENAVYRPARSRYKIYIIDEVHMLSNSAFNALLKILEEPPSHVKFIFATTEPNKVIATIQSRCQRFDFRNIPPQLIGGQLRKILDEEGIKYEEDVIVLLAKMANGSMRDALSLLDRLLSTGQSPLTAEMLGRYLGCAEAEKVYRLVEKIGDGDVGGTLAAAEELISSGQSEVQVVDSLIDCMRDLLVIRSAGADCELLALTPEQHRRTVELAEKFDAAGLVYNITALEKLHWTVKNSESARALLDATLVRFALSEHFLNVEDLVEAVRGQGPAPIKKNGRETRSPTAPAGAEYRSQSKAGGLSPPADEGSIKENWLRFVEMVAEELGPATAGLLKGLSPGRFEGGKLVLSAPGSARVSVKMLESNGRAEQVGRVLSKWLGSPVELVFEFVGGEGSQEKRPKQAGRPAASGKDELISDPAVKMVLLGLDARITGIERES